MIRLVELLHLNQSSEQHDFFLSFPSSGSFKVSFPVLMKKLGICHDGSQDTTHRRCLLHVPAT